MLQMREFDQFHMQSNQKKVQKFKQSEQILYQQTTMLLDCIYKQENPGESPQTQTPTPSHEASKPTTHPTQVSKPKPKPTELPAPIKSTATGPANTEQLKQKLALKGKLEKEAPSAEYIFNKQPSDLFDHLMRIYNQGQRYLDQQQYKKVYQIIKSS